MSGEIPGSNREASEGMDFLEVLSVDRTEPLLYAAGVDAIQASVGDENDRS